MRVGLIGTGAIADKHARAYQTIGYELAVCSNRGIEKGRAFAERFGTRFADNWQDVCTDPTVELVDVCTLPNFRLPIIELCAANRKQVQVQKPIAADLATARAMVDAAKAGGITLSVVSQHRFDDSSIFLKRAIADGRLGRILQADAYVKWFRSDAYYAPPIKGTWAGEGGGVLINQGIHSVDLLLWFVGAVRQVDAQWQLGSVHKIESEDVVNALLRYESGATGVIQASTAFWPGSPERIEIHGTKGTAVIAGDRLITWDIENDSGDPAPLQAAGMSGASDPMAISLTPFERQFQNLGAITGEDGYRALELVDAIYRSCREDRRITLGAKRG